MESHDGHLPILEVVTQEDRSPPRAPCPPYVRFSDRLNTQRPTKDLLLADAYAQRVRLLPILGL